MKRLRSSLGSSARAMLCLLVLFITSLDAVHSHPSINRAGMAPAGGGSHCVLCLAAHMPVAATANAAAIGPLFTAATTLPLLRLEMAREPLSTFSLYMRPPPAF